MKFSLGGNMGLGVFYEEADGSTYPRSAPTTCDSADPVDAIEQTVNASSSGLSYDAVSGRYNYVWKTNSAWAGLTLPQHAEKGALGRMEACLQSASLLTVSTSWLGVGRGIGGLPRPKPEMCRGLRTP